MGVAQDEVAEEAVTLVGDITGITAEAELRKGVMVTTPTPPHNDIQIMWAAVRNVWMEVGQRGENGLIGEMGK